MAAGGYPDAYEKGHKIEGLPQQEIPGEKLFHAGTKAVNSDIVTAGGRVLCACALGDTVAQAQKKAYLLANQIHWKDGFMRKDIGYRAIDRG
jgi:phosphoribosylamine--glycine ligase